MLRHKDAKFCSQCGSKQEIFSQVSPIQEVSASRRRGGEPLCWQCHAQLPEKASFCDQCGSKQEGAQLPPWRLNPFPDARSQSQERTQAPWAVSSNAGQGKRDETLLSPELRRELLECFRTNRFDQLDEIVRKLSRDGQSKVSAALIHVLFDPALEELQPPRSSFGRNGGPIKFPRAKELTSSENEAHRKEGLELFEQMKLSQAFSSDPLVDEWTLFAEASVHGLIQAVSKWEEKRVKGEASWEEIWNLAIFYVRRSDFKQALEVLQPGIDERKAPFTRLRFALYCAAQLLGQQGITADTRNTARDFLSKNLNKWPAPECHLAWMVLEREKQQERVQGTGNQMEHKMWRTFYNLLTQPVTIPRLENRPEKQQVHAFVEQLERLGLTETLIFWLRDYTKRYCAQFGKKERRSSFDEFDFEMWQKLSKAYDLAGDTPQAGDILFHLALEQRKIFLQQRASSEKVSDAAFRYMRGRLINLFELYQRKDLLISRVAFDRFMSFYNVIPEMWYGKEGKNKEELIRVTRPLFEQMRSQQGAEISSEQARRTWAEKPSSPPRLHVQMASPDARLSWKNGETTLDVSVSNPGPGKVTKIRITCPNTENTMLLFKNAVGLDDLEEGQTRLVSVPVVVSPRAREDHLKCRVDLAYQWEWDTEKRSTSYWLQVKVVHFHPLPNPYVFDRPLGSWPQDMLLFQGREKELESVRERFLKQQGKGTPFYFCGMPRIGKTSLLNRLALILKESGECVPCVVDLKAIQTTQQSLGEVVALLTQSVFRDARNSGLTVWNVLPVSADDQEPIPTAWNFFHGFLQQNRFQDHMRLVLLLDNFDLLVMPHTKDLLDLLAVIHKNHHMQFILSGRQRPENLSQICPGTRLFPLTWCSLDLLSFSAVEQLLQKPVVDGGVQIPKVAIEQMLQQTAGHPYLVAMVASRAIERLNTEQRMMLTPQDIDEVVRQVAPRLAGEDSLLFCSSFLTSQERDAVIRFAREAKEKEGELPVNEAQQTLGENLMHSLWEKYVLEYIHSETRGGYMRLPDQIQLCLLGNRQSKVVRKRVGLFVDYENVLPSAGGMSDQKVGEALIRYASQCGEVVCRWASADPRNLGNRIRFKEDLEQAGFQVQLPHDNSRNGKSRKNAADFVLNCLLYEERITTKPDMYVIVSGDGDYYECILSLIKSGATVRLCASSSRGHPAKVYFTLAEERRQHRQAQGLETDFFIDDLDTVL